jgi:ABC-2 type transport system permease protein
MSVLKAERIKLLSTRAPWWCTGIAVVATLGFTALFFSLSGGEIVPTVANTQIAGAQGRTVVLVLAVLAAATEFNWGTMRMTFQAVPSRTPALLAKGVVVGTLSALIGLVVGVGCWTLASLLKPDADLALHTAADWRVVFGQTLTFLMTGLLGVGLGLLLRNVGLTLALALVWTQLLEGLVQFIPRIGRDLYQWMPFHAANQFAGADFGASPVNSGQLPLGPVGYGVYFAIICLVVFGAGVIVNLRRDS